MAWFLDPAGNLVRAHVNALGQLEVAVVAFAVGVDVTDRAARLLGVIYGDQGQLAQRAVTRDLYVQLRNAGVEIDPRARTWVLGAGDVPDLSDRAARLLGVVYGSQAQQLLQRALTFDLQVQLRQAGVEIDPRDVSDRAARLLGVIYGDQGQLAQRAATLDAYVQLRSGGAEIDPRDVSDRAARLLGVIYGSQGNQLLQRALTFETVVQLNQAGAEVAAGNPLPTQDTGLNTNPRRYEKDNGFYSAPTTIGAGVTAIYTIATTPARTAGQSTTVYTIHIYNNTGAAGTCWLEIGGVRVTIEFPLADGQALAFDWPAGLTLGNFDINVNGTQNIVVQISGTEV